MTTAAKRLQCHPRFASDAENASTFALERSRGLLSFFSFSSRYFSHPLCVQFSSRVRRLTDPSTHTLFARFAFFFFFTKKNQGRYDDLKSAQENIDLQTTILSRFDLIFIVRDERLYERDLQIADHVLAIHAGAGEDDGNGPKSAKIDANPEREREQRFLKRYVEYCRATCSPRLVPKSAKLLEDQYVRYRQEMRERAKRGGASAVPVTVRQLEAITRVSESLAKMCLQEKVSEEHVQEALRLFEVSASTPRSGAAEMVVSPGRREG